MAETARSSPRRPAPAEGRPLGEPVPQPRAGRERLFHPFAGDVPVVLVPGLRGSGPRHWQTLWHRAHPSFLRVEQKDWDVPDLEAWADAVARVVRAAPLPPLVVAHSYGCLAAVRAAFRHRLRYAGALLVAPADPQRFDVLSLLPAGSLPYPTVLVASTNDPSLRFTTAGRLAQAWGSHFEALVGAGHVNAESGLGSWPAGIAMLRELAERAAAAGTLGRIAPRRSARVREAARR